MKHALIKSIGILIVELPEGATNVKLRFNRFLTYRNEHSSVIHLFDYKVTGITRATHAIGKWGIEAFLADMRLIEKYLIENN